MSRVDMRKQKRGGWFEASLKRQESIDEAARIFNVPQRNVFESVAWFRAENWDGLSHRGSGRPKQLAGGWILGIYDRITPGNLNSFGSRVAGGR